MNVIRSVAEMQAWSKARSREGKTIGFVPTMGALHAGHLGLAEAAKRDCDVSVASVFVNPTQFGPNEDFDKYPRTFDSDRAALEKVGVDVMFCPPVDDMYPTGGSRLVWVTVDDLSAHWCGASRPGFFRGVATVVSKLFHAVQPDKAYFGEKDFQQLTVIQRMVRELLIAVEIVPMPTAREADGLAMSSRNAYLTPEARRDAAQISVALRHTQALFAAGERRAEVLVEKFRQWLDNISNSELDYAGIADLITLEPIESGPVRAGRLLCAVKMAGARLIDNMPLESKESN